MAQHRARRVAPRWLLPAVAVLALMAVVLVGTLLVRGGGRDEPPEPTAAPPCARAVRVVTATSFAPVLQALAPTLRQGADCVDVSVQTADGRAAAELISRTPADVWIPDDTSWAGTVPGDGLADAPASAAGTIVASSPIFMVTDQPTAGRLRQAGGSWLALANLVAQRSGTTLAVRDPAGSGDGLVGIGSPAEAVWLDVDMDASARWLSVAQPAIRTVPGSATALPERAGEVGLVPEYALLPTLREAVTPVNVLTGTDFTASLRYTWLPTRAAASDPQRAAAMARLLRELTGPGAAGALAAANLRAPLQPAPPGPKLDTVPRLTAKPLGVLKPHHVDHVFASWYSQDRRTNLLVVVDISGSMAEPAPGTKTRLIDLVRQGCRSVAGLLPNDAQMGLWEFGVELRGSRDHRELVGTAALTPAHRATMATAVAGLDAEETGTGLYDTIVAAYTAARDNYRPGVPNQVLVFTDGHNEDDPNTMTAAQLAAKLKAAKDPARPVQLGVAAFGQRTEAAAVAAAIKPVDGYLDKINTADEVAGVFIHVAAGGLHQ